MVVLVGCTDLSKVKNEDKKDDPLELVEPENVAVSGPKTVTFPFKRVIKDRNGRSIDANILAKFDSQLGFEKKSGLQKFVLPLNRLSEDDQAFFEGISDGGDSQSVLESISRAARLGNREAGWKRDIDSAKREAEKLNLPRLTVFLIAGDPESKSLERELLFSREFRKWAGQNLVLCSITVEPPNSKMAITSAMEENRSAAQLYGVRGEPAVVVDIPERPAFYRVPLVGASKVEDMIKAIEKVLKR